MRPALKAIGMWSCSAENLIIGTAIVESGLTYLKQEGAGPAVSIMQIEPFTYLDLRRRLSVDYTNLYGTILATLCMEMLPLNTDFLIGNMTAAVIMARIKYHFAPGALPASNDYLGIASYHKLIYNTAGGATEISKSLQIFKEVCLYAF